MEPSLYLMAAMAVSILLAIIMIGLAAAIHDDH